MFGASEPEQMYLGGDTADLQLATDPRAKPDRANPALGDLRVSLGNFKGNPAAVIYRKMSGSDTEKAALSGTDISSNSGKLGVHFAASDNDFNNLLKSELFQSVVR